MALILHGNHPQGVLGSISPLVSLSLSLCVLSLPPSLPLVTLDDPCRKMQKLERYVSSTKSSTCCLVLHSPNVLMIGAQETTPPTPFQISPSQLGRAFTVLRNASHATFLLSSCIRPFWESMLLLHMSTVAGRRSNHGSNSIDALQIVALCCFLEPLWNLRCSTVIA